MSDQIPPTVFLGQAGEDKKNQYYSVIKFVLKRLDEGKLIELLYDNDEGYLYSSENECHGFYEKKPDKMPSGLSIKQRYERCIDKSKCIVYFLSGAVIEKLRYQYSFVSEECKYIREVWIQLEGINSIFIPIYNYDYEKKVGNQFSLPLGLINDSPPKLSDNGIVVEREMEREELIEKFVSKLNCELKIFEADESKKNFIKECLSKLDSDPPLEIPNSQNIENFVVQKNEGFSILLKYIKVGKLFFSDTKFSEDLRKIGLKDSQIENLIIKLLQEDIISKAELEELTYYIPNNKVSMVINNAYSENSDDFKGGSQ